MEDFLTTTFKSARIQSHTWPPCGRTPPLRAHSHRAGRQGGKGAVAEARGGQGRLLLMGRAPPRGSRRWFVQRSTDPCFGLNEPRETFRQLRPVTLIGSDWGWRNEVGTKGRATAAQRTSPQSRWEPRQSALAHPSPSRQECLVAALQKAWLEARCPLHFWGLWAREDPASPCPTSEVAAWDLQAPLQPLPQQALPGPLHTGSHQRPQALHGLRGHGDAKVIQQDL